MSIVLRTSLLLMATLFTVAAATAQSVDGERAAAEGPRYRIDVRQNEQALGAITVELYPDVAPRHVHNFDSLVSIGFYNGTAFHRVIRDTLIQGGDPNSRDQPEETWGLGTEDQTRVPAEFSDLKHVRGILSAARVVTDVNSATSQFFILCVARPDLDGRFSIYGHVLEGMEVVDSITRVPLGTVSRPMDKVEMTITKLGSSAVAREAAGSSRMSVEARPNPCSNGTAITYVTTGPGRTVVTLHDALGRPVATLVDRTEEAGEHMAILDAEGLAAGAYNCLVRSGQERVWTRVVVMR